MSQNIQDWIKFANYTQGRDKINRLVQYSCRLVIWYATSKDAVGINASTTMARIKALEATVALSRKFFRLGTCVEQASKALTAASGVSADPAVRALSTLSAGGKACWLFLDHFIWAGKIRLIHVNIGKLTSWSAKVWLVGCLCAALLDLYRLMAAVEEIRRLTGDKTSTKRRIDTLRLELLRDACDVLIPLTLLERVNPGIGWMAGVISSIASFKLEWRRMIKRASMSSGFENPLLDSLLDDIYSHHGSLLGTVSSDSTGHQTTDSDNTVTAETSGVFDSSTSRYYSIEFQSYRLYSAFSLDSKSVEELREIRSRLTVETNQVSSKLVRLLKQRDLTNRKVEQSANILTAVLQATSAKTAADAKLSFTLAASPGESGWQKWIDAMRAISRLPGGIPDQFRRKLWVGLADNYLQSNRIDWNAVARAAFNDKSNPDDSALGLQIVKDLHRTGCSNNFLPDNSDVDTERTLLKRVLLAYARWNKQVGYCQGFNVLATVILDTVDRNEIDALKVMIYLIDHVLPANYYAHCLRLLAVDLAVFRHLLSSNLPQLAQHLDKLQKKATTADDGIFYEPPLTNVFLMQWLLTLYATCLPKHALLRLWDCLLLNGSDHLISAGLHIFTKLSKQIMSCQTVDQYYTTMEKAMKVGILREPKPGVVSEADAFIQAVYKPLTPSVGELREQLLYSIQPFMAPSTALSSASTSNFNSGATQTDSSTPASILGCFGSSGGAICCGRSMQHGFDRQNEAYISGLTDDQLRELGAVRERMTTDLKKLRRNYDRLAKHRNKAVVIVPRVLDPTSEEASDSLRSMNDTSSSHSSSKLGRSHSTVSPSSITQPCFLAPTFGGNVINHLMVSKEGLEEINQKVMAAPIVQMVLPSSTQQVVQNPFLASPHSARRYFSSYLARPNSTSTAQKPKLDWTLNNDTGFESFVTSPIGKSSQSDIISSSTSILMSHHDDEILASLPASPEKQLGNIDELREYQSQTISDSDGLVEIDISSDLDKPAKSASSTYSYGSGDADDETATPSSNQTFKLPQYHLSKQPFNYCSDEDAENFHSSISMSPTVSTSEHGELSKKAIRRKSRLNAYFERFAINDIPRREPSFEPCPVNYAVASSYSDFLPRKFTEPISVDEVSSPFPVSAATRLKQRLHLIPGVKAEGSNKLPPETLAK